MTGHTSPEEQTSPQTIVRLDTEVNGCQSHYLRTGSGPAVVLIHGGASDSRDWLATMAGLASRYSLYAPNLPGFSPVDHEHDYHMSDLVEFIAGFIRKLDLERPVIVGHSLGGRVCLGVALAHPELIGRLVLVDSAGIGKTTPWGNIFFTGLWLARALFRVPQPTPRILPDDGGSATWDCRNRLADIKIPTLIIWKKCDPYFSSAQAYRAQSAIPDAKVEIVPGFGHAPHKDRAEYFNRILGEYLENGNTAAIPAH